jgi:hypothetical protein
MNETGYIRFSFATIVRLVGLPFLSSIEAAANNLRNLVCVSTQ